MENLLVSTFKRKKVVVTGHTGFKGSWLCQWLINLGADVFGISNTIPTNPSHYEALGLDSKLTSFFVDIREYNKFSSILSDISPDFIFHLAAQPLVKCSYESPVDTWSTNVLGTVNLLESLRFFSTRCVAIVITSDKCYDNVEWIWGYRENDKLGGPDPYSASKGAAELAISSYFRSFFSSSSSPILIGSSRAGNVIGGGDWAADRIIPDCVKSWSVNSDVLIRRPLSTRPWQHVLEPLSGYLVQAAKLSCDPSLNGESFNFGPNNSSSFTVKQVVDEMAKHWSTVTWRDVSDMYDGPYESTLLQLNVDKSMSLLSWNSALDFETTIKFTADWYKSFYENPELSSTITSDQIHSFTQIAFSKNIEWARNV